MRDAGLPTPVPLGVVEITPEREYLVVTEFLERAERIGEGMVDETVIDDALAVVRGLWDAGLAHRDVKPGNLLVRDGRVLLIDLAFAAVRPSPWRQAVDLANMMLTLALYSTPDLVYERAIRRFTPDEISEAFAATRSVTVPSQLRALLRADGRHLTGRFRALAPPRPRVAVQRWSLRRVGLTLAVAAGAPPTSGRRDNGRSGLPPPRWPPPVSTSGPICRSTSPAEPPSASSSGGAPFSWPDRTFTGRA